MKLIYIAGPLFNTHERWYLERVAEVLEAAGYSTFLPHRDAGLVKLSSYEERYRIFHADIEALKSCDLCVALLNRRGSRIRDKCGTGLSIRPWETLYWSHG